MTDPTRPKTVRERLTEALDAFRDRRKDCQTCDLADVISGIVAEQVAEAVAVKVAKRRKKRKAR